MKWRERIAWGLIVLMAAGLIAGCYSPAGTGSYKPIGTAVSGPPYQHIMAGWRAQQRIIARLRAEQNATVKAVVRQMCGGEIRPQMSQQDLRKICREWGFRLTPASVGTLLCSANPCVIQSTANGVDGLRVIGSKGPLCDHPFLVADWQGTPQFFVSCGQVATGDLPLCVTDPHYRMVGCLSPGTWDAAKGQYTGPAFLEVGGVRLTARDIAWIHAHGG